MQLLCPARILCQPCLHPLFYKDHYSHHQSQYRCFNPGHFRSNSGTAASLAIVLVNPSLLLSIGGVPDRTQAHVRLCQGERSMIEMPFLTGQELNSANEIMVKSNLFVCQVGISPSLCYTDLLKQSMSRTARVADTGTDFFNSWRAAG